MSFHLSHLEQAGLVRSHRDGRQIIYAVEAAVLSDLIAFLLKDCCGGRPEICAPAFAQAGACAPRTGLGPGPGPGPVAPLPRQDPDRLARSSVTREP